MVKMFPIKYTLSSMTNGRVLILKLRLRVMIVTDSSEPTIHHGAGIRPHWPRGYLVGYIEPEHVQKFIQYPQVSAIRGRQFQPDHQEGLEGLNPPDLTDVGLVDAVDESRINLVVAAVELVLREGQAFEDKKLG